MHLNSPEQPGLDPVPGDRHRVRRLGIRRRDGHHHHRLIRLQGQLAPNSIFTSRAAAMSYRDVGSGGDDFCFLAL